MQAWFAAHMPGVKTRIVSLSATYQHDDPKTWEEIKANGDAAIVGVGHCSDCSPAVATHAITLETKYGVPTVALHTDKFDRVVQSVAKMAGLPQAPRAFVPQPVMGKSAAELKAYVDGKDPISGRPVMQEIVAALTAALDDAHAACDARHDDVRRHGAAAARARHGGKPAAVVPGEQLDRQASDRAADRERVAAMLAHTSRKPGDIVGHMQPAKFRVAWEYTVEQVAVNAVMAGARPEYFPVILALAASQVSARGSTSSSAVRDGGGQRSDPATRSA